MPMSRRQLFAGAAASLAPFPPAAGAPRPASPDPELAAVARRYFRALARVARLDRPRRRPAGWNGACDALRSAEAALLDALATRGLVGCVADGRLYVDINAPALGDQSGDGCELNVFDARRIAGL